jgi:hypothetical protein
VPQRWIHRTPPRLSQKQSVPPDWQSSRHRGSPIRGRERIGPGAAHSPLVPMWIWMALCEGHYLVLGNFTNLPMELTWSTGHCWCFGWILWMPCHRLEILRRANLSYLTSNFWLAIILSIIQTSNRLYPG